MYLFSYLILNYFELYWVAANSHNVWLIHQIVLSLPPNVELAAIKHHTYLYSTISAALQHTVYYRQLAGLEKRILFIV